MLSVISIVSVGMGASEGIGASVGVNVSVVQVRWMGMRLLCIAYSLVERDLPHVSSLSPSP